MNQKSDHDLLREYAETGSERAFAELVQQYLDLVYSAAVRVVGDSHLAQDVSQGVFLALARNCGKIRKSVLLPCWLHQTTHHLAANTVRSEVRRRAREREATVMNELLSDSEEPSWEVVAPQLDAALLELNEVDRDALLRRYFKRQPAREMAQVLGISEQAAHKRVGRAVERLREVFRRRGFAIATHAVVAMMVANGVQSAPTGTAASISAVVASGTCVPAAKGMIGIKLLFMTTFQKTLIASAVLASAGLSIYEIRQVTTRHAHARRTQALRATPISASQTAPRAAVRAPAHRVIPRDLPAPRTRIIPLKNSIPGVPFTETELYALLKNKVTQLTLAQVQPYLEANGRSAKSLLAAFRTTSALDLLKEAAQRFPSDPQVAFEAAIRLGATPAERLPWLEALRQASADNCLPDYLAAVAHFQAGDQIGAVRDLIAASGKTSYTDFSRERIQANEEAYLAAGYPPGEAKMIASICLAEPHLLQVKELGQDLVSLANAYQQAGDTSSRESALQIAVNLGQRLSDPSAGETLLRQTIGISLERAALQAMDPASPLDTAGLTVQGRLDQLTRRVDEIRSLAREVDPLWKTLADQDWVNYGNQFTVAGEETAIQWLVSNHSLGTMATTGR